MRREMTSVRHLLVVAAAAAIIWAGNAVVLPLLSAAGLADRVAEWRAVDQPLGGLGAIVWALALAAVTSITQESMRVQTLRGAAAIGLTVGVILFAGQLPWASSRLIGVAAAVSGARAISIAAASMLLFQSKRPWSRDGASPMSTAL